MATEHIEVIEYGDFEYEDIEDEYLVEYQQCIISGQTVRIMNGFCIIDNDGMVIGLFKDGRAQMLKFWNGTEWICNTKNNISQ